MISNLRQKLQSKMRNFGISKIRQNKLMVDLGWASGAPKSPLIESHMLYISQGGPFYYNSHAFYRYFGKKSSNYQFEGEFFRRRKSLFNEKTSRR